MMKPSLTPPKIKNQKRRGESQRRMLTDRRRVLRFCDDPAFKPASCRIARMALRKRETMARMAW
jgi:hypothetical protein